MRELEVLHDQLLWLFEHHPDLHARGRRRDDAGHRRRTRPHRGGLRRRARRPRRIPFTIADRSLRAESTLVDGVPGAARAARQPLRRRPAPDPARDAGGAPALRLRGRRPRPGAAAGGRERACAGEWTPPRAPVLGLPGTSRSTPGASASTACCSGSRCRAASGGCVGGVLPCDAVEGSDAQVLGRLAGFVDSGGRARGDARRAARGAGVGATLARGAGALPRSRRRRRRGGAGGARRTRPPRRRCGPGGLRGRHPLDLVRVCCARSSSVRRRGAAFSPAASPSARWCRCAACRSRSSAWSG